MKTINISKWTGAVALISALLVGRSASSACSELVSAHAGYILSSPTTSFIFWPPGRPDWQFHWVLWQSLLGNAEFYYPHVTQYGIYGGKGTFYMGASPAHPGVPQNESWIVNEIVATLENAHTMPRDQETFVVLMPSDSIFAKHDYHSGQALDHGHHDYFNHTFSDGVTRNVPYSVIEYNQGDLTMTNITISHELYETYTDPFPYVDGNGNFSGLGYWDESVDQMTLMGSYSSELADLCVNRDPNMITPPFWQMQSASVQLAQLWSQVTCSCW